MQYCVIRTEDIETKVNEHFAGYVHVYGPYRTKESAKKNMIATAKRFYNLINKKNGGNLPKEKLSFVHYDNNDFASVYDNTRYDSHEYSFEVHSMCK